MQFTKIRLSGRTNIDLQVFGLRPSNQWILKDADGIGPPEVNVFLSGGQYQGRKAVSRQIVLKVGLNPNHAIGQTAAAMRNTLYGLLTPGPTDSITVRFMNGPNVVVDAVGYIKNIEVVPFSKDPEVQITVDCLEPYLTAPGYVEQTITSGDEEFTIENEGSVTTGFYIEVTFNASVAAWTLYSEQAGSGPRMRFDYAFLSGDKLKINTRSGQRYVKRTRSGTTIWLIKAMSSDSHWFELHPGENTFWTTFTGISEIEFHHTPQYWGV